MFRVPVYASLASPRPALRGRRAGEGSAGRERCRAEASLDQQFTPRHAPPPRLRALGPDDVRIRVVPTPELVRVSQLIRVLLGIEPETLRGHSCNLSFLLASRGSLATPNRGNAVDRDERAAGARTACASSTLLAPIHPVIAHAARSPPESGRTRTLVNRAPCWRDRQATCRLPCARRRVDRSAICMRL